MGHGVRNRSRPLRHTFRSSVFFLRVLSRCTLRTKIYPRPLRFISTSLYVTTRISIGVRRYLLLFTYETSWNVFLNLPSPAWVTKASCRLGGRFASLAPYICSGLACIAVNPIYVPHVIYRC